MNKLILILTLLFGALCVACGLLAAFNLLAPATWCWLPAGRAAIIGAVATFILAIPLVPTAKAQQPSERPEAAAAESSSQNT